MNRYSTIQFEIEAEFSLETMDDIWVTFEQGKTTFTKKKSAGEVTVKENCCYATLSQNESALFNAYAPIAVQVRWAGNGVSDSSEIDYFSLGDVLEEGEIGV